MSSSLIFDPLLPIWVLMLCGGGVIVITAWALWRRLMGWALRGLAGLCVMIAMANPALQSENRTVLNDIVMVVVDDSSSQGVADRPNQTQMVLKHVLTKLDNRANTDVRVIRVDDGANDGGSLVMQALQQALADEPTAQIAGAIVISDGHIHDAELPVTLPAPLHVLLTGQPDDWDRRLVIRNAPAYAIVGKPVQLTLQIQDQGQAPIGTTVPLDISVDGEIPQTFNLPLNEDIDVSLNLPHGGMNVVQITTPNTDGELTDQNNTAVIRINAVRDRLRVLLVSGEPHPGERTWRNLLKSDSAVDLVHFTILRPPNKQGGVPISELSLIAFPTRELFLDKINEFDLIIFDRYKRRGILPTAYFDSVVSYVEQGGAVLVAAGPDYASVDSLYRSSLEQILPGAPTARVFEEGILPVVSDVGQRHPVTEGLVDHAPAGGWGRWMRQIEVFPINGDVLMTGKDDAPLLLVDRVAQGRVALLASDHAWLWDRGFEGGGPQGELLRRLAHWMMKEPQLEEDALWADETEIGLQFTRRSLQPLDDAGLTITTPDGTQLQLPLREVSPGRYIGDLKTDALGLYRFNDDTLQAVTALGPTAPREFLETVATGDKMATAVAATGGGILHISDGIPRLRDTRVGRPASGRGWIGLHKRDAFARQNVSLTALLPVWAYLLMSAGFMIAAWLREGRQ